MIYLEGKYNNAKVFTDFIDSQTMSQIIELCNQKFVENQKIRIMPDCHAGAGCTIGTTLTINDKVVPNLVGVDIGCAIDAIKLKDSIIDFMKLDSIIREYIPSGMSIREKTYLDSKEYKTNINELICKQFVNLERGNASVGTLGGGNHFIEVSKDSNNNLWLLVHSGSRNIGKQVAEYYQKLACNNSNDKDKIIKDIAYDLKSQGRQSEIEDVIKSMYSPKITKGLEYLDGNDFNDYIHDMKIMQNYAFVNRTVILNTIIQKMGLTESDRIFTIHNYIDTNNMILRKGAVSACKNQQLIIPMNMRDGSLLCVGKGNEDWNYSAPHGAGRIMSRSKAKELVSLEEFEKSMNGIYTTSVMQSTIDESPMAYKPMQKIIDNIKDTVDIIDILKPVYNFKAN